MFFTIVICLLGALAGAWFRFLTRERNSAWLVTAVLAAAALALFLLKPPGQEFFAIWAGVIAAAAAGALVCGATLRLRR